MTKVTTGDTLNGAHSLASSSGQDIKESQALVSQERNVNGLAYGEERASAELEQGRSTDEEREENRQTTQLPPQSAAVAPPHAPPTATPHPPSLVQSGSSVVDSSMSESAVRTAPPALVGYEAVSKEGRGEERGEMEANGRERDAGERPREAGEGEEGSKRVVSEGESKLQVRHTREESPDLVIDTHSQHVGEGAPSIINNPETESNEKHKHVGVNLVTRNSQVLPESAEAVALNRENLIGQPDSPHSSSGNEDVDLDMEIIEEGEEEEGESETPPTAPPPKGVLMKADNTTTISQTGHLQSPHPHIGISPSHTAAIESLKKGESVRKPNVIVATPSSSGAGGHNPNREGGGGGGGESGKDRYSVVSDSFRVRQVAKVKQFFTTLQQFGNKNGSEVAEQVQELITAVVVRE